ncbi:mitochondrial lipoate-protein ligase [Phlyctema vagabunda]|uniref:lipoyl(octanoyl) transferase n=1 Tax=Phlyctema vagabunda TaxID=108571 RepID=A0ABR4PAY0_9HELO
MAKLNPGPLLKASRSFKLALSRPMSTYPVLSLEHDSHAPTVADNSSNNESEEIAPTVLEHYAKQSPILCYGNANMWQQEMVDYALAYKAAVSSPTPPNLHYKPKPTILSFTPSPVYTTGRREKDSLSPEQIKKLERPMWIKDVGLMRADVVHTLRGGQTTFHGPGQLVIYPILDLSAIRTKLWPKGISVRCYVRLLEETTIKTLAHYDISATRTENPGVWMVDGERGERKIAALGIHLRRNITSFGVALNVNTNLEWYDRITACGLEGKGITNMTSELPVRPIYERSSKNIATHQVGRRWVDIFVAEIWGKEGVAAHLRPSSAPWPELISTTAYNKRLEEIDREGSKPIQTPRPHMRFFKHGNKSLGHVQAPVKIIKYEPVKDTYWWSHKKRSRSSH